MLVEIVSDPVCPWCYIGKRHFDGAVAMLRAEGVTTDITVQLRAFQLDPGAPIGSPRPVREAYAQRFGGDDRAARIMQHVTDAAATAGITFAMDRALRANTRSAHQVLKLVQQVSPELQTSVNESVMQAYFVEGRDISDPVTLDDCAARAGFTTHRPSEHLGDSVARHTLDDAVDGDLRWAAERGITSVPTFVINEAFDIPGAQDAATFARLLRRLTNER